MITPPRSLLFMPANNLRAHEKATELAADALIFDLEDAVAENDKAEARRCVKLSLAQHHYRQKRLFLRINHPESAHAQEDIALLAQYPQFSGIVVPKVENAETLQHVCRLMENADCPAGQTILAMLETPLGVINASAIAQGNNRLTGFIAGTNDLKAALRLPESENRAGLHHALAQIVLAARAHGLMVFDGVYNQLHNDAGLTQECAQGRAWGFDGKSIIHPAHIAITNAAFSPNDEEVKHAAEVMSRWQSRKSGVSTADGAMIEELHVRNAQRILAMHKNILENSSE